jgi:uncharacterized protein YegL
MREVCALIALVFFSMSVSVIAQQGTSSSSVMRSRAMSKGTTPNQPTPNYYEPQPIFTPPDFIVVDEFVNFHKHNLPMPKAGQSVAMDVRWGNKQVSFSNAEAILQIGFTTPHFDSNKELKPLNLVLVIDKSGSMSDGDKMPRVKQALLTMVNQLRPNDIVSIVVFDSYAEVLVPAEKVGNGEKLRRAIACLEPGSSTNLHAGLMLGYREALKNFNREGANRVILLTDGIANTGVTDPQQISRESLKCNQEGIDLSTIGVGLSLDKNLLQTLAKSGRGLFHFVADTQDIEKVFVSEYQSLVSPVAREVELKVDYDSSLELDEIYGYEPQYKSHGVTIPIDDMNNGLTQVVLMKFKARDKGENNVRVKLSYFDIDKNKRVEETKESSLTASDKKSCDMLADKEVRKNYTIALLAQGLYNMTGACKTGNYKRAEACLNEALNEAYSNFPKMNDKDIQYTLDIAERYRDQLKDFNKRRGNCGECR